MAMAKPIIGPIEEAIRSNPNAAGLALIISNDYKGIANLNPLTGTKKDGETMQMTFNYLGFAVVHMHNVTKVKLQQVIREMTQLRKYPESYKCISFVFSGHGNCETGREKRVLKYLYDSRGSKFEITGILEPFMPKNAKTIGSIPKLFFIDACRGQKDMYHEAVTVPKGGGSEVECDVLQKGGKEIELMDVPAIGNYLIAYSTIENYQSYEVSRVGGIWLNTLSNQLREKAGSKSITDILILVNQELMEKYQHPHFRKAMTQPEFICQLDKVVYLGPRDQMASSYGRQNSLGAAAGFAVSKGVNYRQHLHNDLYQTGHVISRPEFSDPLSHPEGGFIGTVSFKIMETGEKRTFESDKPEQTKNQASENAAKHAVLAVQAFVTAKSGVKGVLSGRQQSSHPVLVTQQPAATSDHSSKTPVMRLKEYCEKQKPRLWESFEEIPAGSVGTPNMFRFKVTVKSNDKRTIVAAASGDRKAAKQEAKHSAAERVLDQLK